VGSGFGGSGADGGEGEGGGVWELKEEMCKSVEERMSSVNERADALVRDLKNMPSQLAGPQISQS
jgi:hypothetical protein